MPTFVLYRVQATYMLFHHLEATIPVFSFLVKGIIDVHPHTILAITLSLPLSCTDGQNERDGDSADTATLDLKMTRTLFGRPTLNEHHSENHGQLSFQLHSSRLAYIHICMGSCLTYLVVLYFERLLGLLIIGASISMWICGHDPPS